MKFIPKYDPAFKPLSVVLRDFENEVKESDHEKFKICVERQEGYNYIYNLDVFKDAKKLNENFLIIERIIKSILWIIGGYKIYVCGNHDLCELVKKAYTKEGIRSFDKDFMQTVYDNEFAVIEVKEEDFPTLKVSEKKIGGHLNGCRIGFDAGGSDRKVSAVVDGKVIYSEEVVWFPKLNSDYHYHIEGIREALKSAASKMDHVDAIGVSTAGVCISNKVMVSSLFKEIPQEFQKDYVQPIYLNLAKEMGVPISVENDGDITALAGAMDLADDSVLGIAMGTSEAAGYINKNGLLNGWLSECAFVPVDVNPNAMVDEWSNDYGCGVKYFSQDAVIKLANNAGIKFAENATPYEKLKYVQGLLNENNEIAYQIFEDIGIYLGYAIPYYARFYDIKHLLILGRVTSFKCGEIIINKAYEVLKAEFSELANINICVPSETNKRVGQSIAAASLVDIE